MCVFMYLCMHVCMYIYRYVFINVCVHTYQPGTYVFIYLFVVCVTSVSVGQQAVYCRTVCKSNEPLRKEI